MFFPVSNGRLFLPNLGPSGQAKLKKQNNIHVYKYSEKLEKGGGDNQMPEL